MSKWEQWYDAQPLHIKKWIDHQPIWKHDEMIGIMIGAFVVGFLLGLVF